MEAEKEKECFEKEIPKSDYYDNDYIKSIIEDSEPKILKPQLIQLAYHRHALLGLFNLFVTKDLMKAIVNWTNLHIEMKASSTKPVTVPELKKYIGLELAMSITKFNRIEDYWSMEPFLGHDDFKRTMSKNRYRDIRRFLIFRNPHTNRQKESSDDPLWHCRSLLNHFLRQCVKFCVPGRVSSLDENSVRCSGRCRAVTSYIPMKPEKFAIRFYGIVCWRSLYLFSLFDNSAGLRSPLPPVARYNALHSIMKTPIEKAFDATKRMQSAIKKDSPGALWAAQCAHMEKLAQTQTKGNRLVIMDNYYTRHALAKFLRELTDQKVRVIGTVKLTNVDALNTRNLEEACALLKNAPRGSWKLVAVYDPPPNLEDQRKEHAKEMRKRKRQKQTMLPFSPSDGTVAKNCGFVLFVDKKIVMIYTNDLSGTPSEKIIDGSSAEAIRLVQGLASMKRWTGGESLHRTTLQVPAIFAAYNIFMNAVDRVDQIRASLVTMRKEIRVNMSIWTAILDWSTMNSYSLYKSLKLGNLPFREYKLMLVKQLCHGLEDDEEENPVAPTDDVGEDDATTSTVASRNQPEPEMAKLIREAIGSSEGVHHILPLANRMRQNREASENEDDVRMRSSIECRLCSLCKDAGDLKHYKTTYGCAACKSAYHPECFTIVHSSKGMNPDMEIFKRLCLGIAKRKKDGTREQGRRIRPVTKTQNIENVEAIKIPCMAGWKK